MASASCCAFSGSMHSPLPEASTISWLSPRTASTMGQRMAMLSKILEGMTVRNRSSFLSSTRDAPVMDHSRGMSRSEERRVGKEGRYGRAPAQYTEKEERLAMQDEKM